MALEVVDVVRREFAIDERRVYVMGQSMGGAGVWNVMAHRPHFFAAAVICCGSNSPDDGTASIEMQLWTSTQTPTTRYQCPYRASVWRQDGRPEASPSTPSTRA
jgi:poly(3-hydroxybutyrate) depolymerase